MFPDDGAFAATLPTVSRDAYGISRVACSKDLQVSDFTDNILYNYPTKYHQMLRAFGAEPKYGKNSIFVSAHLTNTG